MKCPQCQHEMTKGTTAWICINCGHHESLDAVPAAAVVPAPEPAPVPEPTPALVSSEVPAVSSAPPVTPPVAQPTATPIQSAATSIPGIMPPSAPKKHRWGLIAVLGGILFLGGGITYAAFYYTSVKPTTALASYLAKVASAKSETFKATASFHADGQDPIAEEASATINGKYDGSKAGDERIAGKLTGKYGKSTFGVEAVATQKTLYFKFDKSDLLTMFGIMFGTDWYKLDISEADPDKCKDSYNPETFINQFGIKDIPVKDTKLVNWRETVDGHATTHYTGKFDFDKLQASIDKANNKLSADCKITFKASDFDGVIVSYDVWEGSNFDRVTVNYNNTKEKYRVEVTMDTTDYNKAVTIVEPKDAKDINELFGGSGSNSTSSTASTEVQARDTQRRADIREIRNGLETFYADNGYYPPLASWQLDLTKKNYIKKVPTDPKTNAQYSYEPSPSGCKTDKCQTYVLSAVLEDTSTSDGATYKKESLNK